MSPIRISTGSTTGSGTFKIEIERGYTTSGGQPIYVLLASDSEADHVLDNLELSSDSLANHFFIRFQPTDTLAASLQFTAADIDAVARLGFVQVQINSGTGSLQAGIQIKLADPRLGAYNDGRITLPELFSGLVDSQVLSRLVTSATFTGSANLVLPLGASLLNVTWTDITNTATMAVQFNRDAEAYLNFLNLDYSNGISAGLGQFITFLSALDGFGVLGRKLPGLNRSVVELLNLNGKFDLVRSTLDNAGPTVAQGLESALRSALGLPANSPNVAVTFDQSSSSRALKIHLLFSVDYAARLPLDVSLASLNLPSVGSLVDVGGKALVDVNAHAALTLDFGVDLTAPASPRPFLYDTTGFDTTARFSTTGLNFTAALGPLGLFVVNGSAVLDVDGAGAGAAPASFAVRLQDRNGDGRYYYARC